MLILESRRIQLLLVTVVALALAACGSDEAARVSAFETGADLSRDVGRTFDASADTSESDASDDVVADAPTDLAPDSESDLPSDAVSDADAVLDADADVVPDAGAVADADADVMPDVDAEPVRPPNCGDGIVNDDEECDDGNEVETDECNNLCRRSFCGDGIINATLGVATVSAPLVNAFGQEGYVCDDGAACSTGPSPTVCEVSEIANASEHGICEALGFDRALSATWGGGPGEALAPMHHAFNWECADYVCFESPFAFFDSDCSAFEMLAEISCEGIVGEECDDGAANSDEADAECRLDCVFPGCGDGVVDTGEECDNGDENADIADACRIDCTIPTCGDGIADTPEECDDGDEIDDDECTNSCFRGEASFAVCADGSIGSATGVASTGTTFGMGDDYTASCAASSNGNDWALAWVAPTSGRYEFDTSGSEYDTALALRAAPLSIILDACLESIELACNDDSIYGLRSQIVYDVVAGTEYLIVVDGFASSAGGPYILNITAPF